MTRLIDKLRNNNKDIVELNWPGTLDKLEELIISESTNFGKGSIYVEIGSKYIEELLNTFAKDNGLEAEIDFSGRRCSVGLYLIWGYKEANVMEPDCSIDNNGVMRIKK